jgi:hypothetical protein
MGSSIELARQDYLEDIRANRAGISQAEKQCFEEVIEKACKKREKSLWKQAKWAKS